MQDDFTTIFWNTWFEMQDGTRGDGTSVAKRLQELIDTYNPDVFGLNEVYFKTSQDRSLLVAVLEENGYHTHFAMQIVGDKDQVIGNLFASRQKPVSVTEHVFGGNAKSHISWYKEYTPRLIEAKLRINGEDVTVIVVHLCVLVPSDILIHIRHRRSYDHVIDTLDSKNLVIGGDFNELKYMPPWLHLPSRFKRKTGTLYNPTLLLNGKRSGLLRGNVDNVVYSTDGSIRLATFEVLDRTPSDHAPLLAQFRFG